MYTAWDIFASEFFGTAVLLTLGVGVVATNLLPKSKGRGTGWLMINWGWGLGVFLGVYAAWKTGGHLNPAVTLAKVVAYWHDPAVTLNGAAVDSATAIPVTGTNVAIYMIAQMLGGFVGAVIAWLAFKKQYDAKGATPAEKLGTFATGPEIRSYGWNFVTEAIATAVLIIFVMVAGGTPTSVGPLAVALVIVSIGASLGGPTGYAINPARDLGPRVAHAVLPIPDKGDSDWSYAWVPVVAPMVGAVIAVVLVYLFGLGSIDITAALPL